jgi:hypothetical protein
MFFGPSEKEQHAQQYSQAAWSILKQLCMQHSQAVWCEARNNGRAKRNRSRSRSRSRGKELFQLHSEEQEPPPQLRRSRLLEQFEADASSVESVNSSEITATEQEGDFEQEQQGASSSSAQEITATEQEQQGTSEQEQEQNEEQQGNFEQEQEQDEEHQGNKLDFIKKMFRKATRCSAQEITAQKGDCWYPVTGVAGLSASKMLNAASTASSSGTSSSEPHNPGGNAVAPAVAARGSVLHSQQLDELERLLAARTALLTSWLPDRDILAALPSPSRGELEPGTHQI